MIFGLRLENLKLNSIINTENKMKERNVKIAYIGGGSRGWAKIFMTDMAKEDAFTADVHLYDIDYKAAQMNESIGNDLSARADIIGKHRYIADKTAKEALMGADFVVMSIQPATFEEMRSDVHTPEKYGIYQPVGDSTGPGGIVRALRTIPIYADYARMIGEYCPNAWVINYTNPMTICTRTLYKAFPQIKAFGCCHEVFTTQKMFACWLKDEMGVEVNRSEIKIDVAGVNHFTWLTSAKYKTLDLYPLYQKYVDKYWEDGWQFSEEEHWMNNAFGNRNRVKFDLFKRYGRIAAAGDRHLAEFCPREWYLKSPEQIKSWNYMLTTVDYRIQDLQERLERADRLFRREEKLVLRDTGEEGVEQIKAILGFKELVTNVNLPNIGQMPDLQKDAVVETNAVFRGDSVVPVMAGKLPDDVLSLIQRISREQEIIVDSAMKQDYEAVFRAFANDPLITLPVDEAKKLYVEMLENTKEYIPNVNEYLAKQS